MTRTVDVVIKATVGLADEWAYPEGMSLLECVEADMDFDPAAFWMEQVTHHEFTVVDPS